MWLVQMETMHGSFRTVNRTMLREMCKAELHAHLCARGFDPYGWTVKEMREVAISDYNEEFKSRKG